MTTVLKTQGGKQINVEGVKPTTTVVVRQNVAYVRINEVLFDQVETQLVDQSVLGSFPYEVK